MLTPTSLRNKWLRSLLIISGTIITTSTLCASSPSTAKSWLDEQVNFAFNKISENISPADALPGAVIAAKTRNNPNYYYHWVRDAGLTIDSLLGLYETTSNAKTKDTIAQKVTEYLSFSAKIQKVYTLTDLGEPKFNVDATAYNEPWGRPQNDSPAIRAISLIHWANILIQEGKKSYVLTNMYDARLPATSPIKMDLEYVSHHWRDPSFDLWEEVKGTHFYTLMVERRALLEGAMLAHNLGDEGAANWYHQQGKAIEVELEKFWDADKGYIVATLNRTGGLDYKNSNLDIAVVLGLLHGDMHDGFFAWDDVRVSATIKKLVSSFAKIYPINNRSDIPGIAIGRYPEDRYAGANFEGGNPWPLCTLAVAEALYRNAQTLTLKGDFEHASLASSYADAFVDRVHYHANKDGSLNEQMDRNTGYMTSVSDLTWNYAALLTTEHSVH